MNNKAGETPSVALWNPNLFSFDVGVDTNNYKPYSLLDVEKIMSNKNFKPVDKHETRK